AIAELLVDAGGRARRYQLPVAVADRRPSTVPRSAEIRTTSHEVTYDAAFDSEFRAGLASTLVDGAAATATDGASWRVQPFRPATTGAHEPTRLGSAEQSNTSIIVGSSAVIKLFRLLTAGEHPDAEMGEFLTARSNFTNTPRLLATMHVAHDGELT